jgi:hypothetical protein
MRTKRLIIPLLMIFTMIAVSACLVTVTEETPSADSVAAAPTDTPEQAVPATATSVPTNTPTPAPTDTPTPAPTATATGTAEPRPPFDGVFGGIINGDLGSSAPITLEMTQIGNDLSGTAVLGDGLIVDVGGGFCPGAQPVPATDVDLEGQANPNTPRHLERQSVVEVSGFDIIVTIVGDLSDDDNTLTVRMDLGVPWPCRSATLQGVLERLG